MQIQKNVPTWDELLVTINSAKEHPSDTAWSIYRYLNANYKEIGSEEARYLLAIYIKLPLQRPSLLHSCIISVALKMSEVYADFKLTTFMEMCGYPQCLRREDFERQTGKDGRTYNSLKEKADKALESYKLHNPDARSETEDSIHTMFAVKMFETEKNGRKLKSVKLVGADGGELLADSHLFKCKPWEIVGRPFDVLVRMSKEGNRRAHEIVESTKQMDEVFTSEVGYVERYDSQYGHYHIFDNTSRHFVAERPNIKPTVGSFVKFAPIIPKQDKFKSAYLYSVMDETDGLNAFGTYKAVVKYVNEEKGYFYYKLLDMPPATPEGEYTDEGSAQLSVVEGNTPLTVGQEIRLLLFLTRGKDRVKHNHVVKVILN